MYKVVFRFTHSKRVRESPQTPFPFRAGSIVKEKVRAPGKEEEMGPKDPFLPLSRLARSIRKKLDRHLQGEKANGRRKKGGEKASVSARPCRHKSREMVFAK